MTPPSVYGRAWIPRDAADVRRRMRRHRWAIRLLARNQETRQHIEAAGYHIACLGLCDRYLSFFAGADERHAPLAPSLPPLMAWHADGPRRAGTSQAPASGTNWTGFRWPWMGNGRADGLRP